MKSVFRAACDSCHRRKTRCIVLSGNICQYCRQSGHRCVYSPRSNMARSHFEQQTLVPHEFTSSARTPKRRVSAAADLPLLSPPFTSLTCDSPPTAETRLLEPSIGQRNLVSIYAELSQLLFMINNHKPHDMLVKDSGDSFESISAVVSSLCEILSFLEGQPCSSREQQGKAVSVSPCFLLAISVAGSSVNVYNKMAQTLDSFAGAPEAMAPLNLHRTLQVLANAQTMEYQLVYMRRICQSSEQELCRMQTVASVDATLELLRNYSQRVLSGKLYLFMP
ncbi:hypothetical protein PWT90_04145 [Aphanocladium album]|nr:hypothetical protein PWT90_04145 [Aphanocladium album]